MTNSTYVGQPWTRRVALGVSMIAMSISLSGCGGDFARQFANRLSAQATPNALTMQPGTASSFTLDVQCEAASIDSVETEFLPRPLPTGLTVAVVNPVPDLATQRVSCASPGASSQVNTVQLTVRVSASASVALGQSRITARLVGSGPQSIFALTDVAEVPIDLTIAASAYGRNLLINPEFSTPVTQGLLPTAPGNWQGDLAASVAAEQGIAPRSASSMLRFDATGNVGSTNTFASQQWQIVNVSAQAADIAAGRVRADASAWFNRVAGDPDTDRRFDIRLLAFSGSGAALPAAYSAGSQLAVQAGTILSNDNAWQQATAVMTLPAGTTLLLVEIYAYEDVANEGTSPELAGHYADDISLVLTRN